MTPISSNKELYVDMKPDVTRAALSCSVLTVLVK